MTKIYLIISLTILFLGTGCNKCQTHFISDAQIRKQIMTDLQSKRSLLPHGDLFTILDESMTAQENEALSFLYAYMPIGDITDYSGEFYLKNIRSSFQAKEEMPWGKDIPEMIFRHFVLPVRVNNENLDESRLLFYNELKERVKGLSLYDAVLEVNHWCHEKVIYTPSDARTSSPLASVRTAYGRCGEESVFTVAALRAVGIPARQVYTPRWAHTDDNHAWVEAWVDGKWNFLGACEPEPTLNLSWFNGPAYRGILMHTKAFGSYHGPEEIMTSTNCYTEINITNNYAPTAKCIVSVVNKAGEPVNGAEVEFKLYNYAEFYTVAKKVSDSEGKAFLTAGKGDMLVWVTKDHSFGFGKVSFGKDELINITLDKKPGDIIDLPLDIIPPIDGVIPANVTDEQKEENSKRLQDEDLIRNNYVATFYTEEKAVKLADELGLDKDKLVWMMQGSRGNWMEIEQFLRSLPSKQLPSAMMLLESISAKDLRDTPASVLSNHLLQTNEENSKQFYDYVQNPRVSNELLTAYRGFFRDAVPADLASQYKENPEKLVDWVKMNITVDDNLNPQQIPVMPVGVWNARVADTHSRNIFFVAVARSLGIPSRIEPVAGKVQYAKGLHWADVDFETASSMNVVQGKVEASYKAIKALDDPKYYRHFTIAKILPDGQLQTLNFEDGSHADMGLGDSWSRLLKKPLPLDKGHYLLVTGNRMAKGNVLVSITSFNVETDKTTKIDLAVRESEDDIQVIGNIDAEAKFRLAETGDATSILATTGRGYFIVGILGSRQEPTNHAMRDIATVAKDLEAWNRSMILLFKDEQGWKNFDTKEFGTLPDTITYGIDMNNNITNMLTSAMQLSDANTLPIFVIADTFGRVVFVSQGYTIGLGEQMMRVIHKL
ncbi:hypothetical protein M2459_003493 [Parabacteroides sp. PF5-5]|uniref:transglutaminase domain-containing protein n=1 Tax=unclassified Parabacteroides TaxID=2649774 RepID=UPI002474AC2B|nr:MULTISPECIES: transglutaminase domain-containing protein [unclassified Parabacteroides]MDH6306880.1 hypothetical protein [Parabacteroides sp. PH5-39]MDH6317732.1 hypothetical protein [Parabacteroides sp. PF5-13]MDH6321604.1 hypothetical protein [Parabacteroides sp. PH5-13]MDH6325267.1 hypothetical protein [Parabacteroides sp. PH5-8]MDH6328917.1 hypothetical protein [Parabacteroides sp. PH5-41]